MRTTLTLDSDVAMQLGKEVRRAGKTFKAVVNDALRVGLGLAGKPVQPPSYKITAFVSGLAPGLDPDKMNQHLDELEIEEYLGR